MNIISTIITKCFDLILWPFGRHPSIGLIVLSLLTGIALAIIFKYASNQKRIRAAKDRFKARILEMRIYQDDFLSIVRSLFGALWANVFYLRHSFRPILFLIVPVGIIVIQMDARYARRPLQPGEKTILELLLAPGVDPYSVEASVSSVSGVRVDSRPVRIADPPEIDWRLEVLEAGRHEIGVSVNGARYVFPVIAEEKNRVIGHERKASSFWEPLIHPGLPSFSGDSQIVGVRIQYPSLSHPLLFWHTHWIVVLLFYSLVGALVSKFLFKVEI
ncbi:MAG: hypothetical protein GTO51_06980 [Candidatus Latescibacteria bacterium]|nr:hypothetical protein [Candidatus Latescibacterota bacterium]NIM21544.1 hypothetical protein [Candidatus Latescibacterota bacterium]NIM65715.1 hypothetical protein [Candidatus Latescibacterota bacterium]NIO02097.1 hypothetical protein [Candidatus Latescibacterota bacterium]NIO28909.1 hypothetical protein [Candidatus Latescibacterota bacterium]